MRLVWVLTLTAGCWTGSAAPRPTTPYPEPPPVVRDPYPLHSEWRGTYRCSQGITAMYLVLDARPDGTLAARFDFGPTADNPTIPTGSYRLVGTIAAGRQHTFEIRLDPSEWISAPDGYIMVAMSATSSRRWGRLVGRINHPSCGEVDVRRTD